MTKTTRVTQTSSDGTVTNVITGSTTGTVFMLGKVTGPVETTSRDDDNDGDDSTEFWIGGVRVL